jgi:hypothetical protein
MSYSSKNKTDPYEWANRVIRRPDLTLFNKNRLLLECKSCYYPGVTVDMRISNQRSSCSNCFIPHAIVVRGKRVRYRPILPGKGWKVDNLFR